MEVSRRLNVLITGVVEEVTETEGDKDKTPLEKQVYKQSDKCQVKYCSDTHW